MRYIMRTLYVVTVATLLVGCGGANNSATRTGKLSLTVIWPKRTKLIPLASNSIRAAVTSGGQTLGSQLIVGNDGPLNNPSIVTYNNLPVGAATLTATAFPQSDGTGVAQATGAVPANIVAGQTTNVTVNMASTIDHLTITPANPSILVAASQQLTMTGLNQLNQVVLTSPSKVTWNSGTPGKATITNVGNVTGVATGTSLITVTETESGKNANTTVTVTAGGGRQVKIAFASFRDAKSGIYLMNPDGSSQTRISNLAVGDTSPAISPDGTKIAFVSGGAQFGEIEIFVMNSDGTNRTQLTSGPTSPNVEPAWSPDGTKIAFRSGRDGNPEIYTMNADGSNQTRLTNNPSGDTEPAWSPDGSKIAFVSSRDSNDDIFVMNADGSNVTKLTNNQSGGEELSPAWSPDGTKIAFSSERDNGDAEIYVMNADGSNQTRLTNNAAFDGQPAWSPDGTKIAFQSRRDGNDEIYVMDANGANQTRLTNNPTKSNEEPAFGRI